MAEEVRVSDLDTSGAKGIYDSQSFCNSVIIDVNDALTKLFGNQPVAFCNTMLQIIRKMDLLRNGIADDLASKNREIEHWKQHCNELEEDKERLIQAINDLKGVNGNGCYDASSKAKNV